VCLPPAWQEVQSNKLQVIFDSVNLISLENHRDQERITKESFDLFGDRIAAIHTKDFTIEGRTYRHIHTGQGQLNYRLLLDLIQKRKPYISILLEEVGEAGAEGCVRYILETAPQMEHE
jgi:L-ribulose-5-phosphate 3-epimerase UlaE